MGIFDRLGRVARSEVSEMKRVLREARRERGASVSDDPWDDQLSYEADILAADAELARDLGDPLSDVFARELGTRPAAPAGGLDDDMARGASLWGAPTSSAAPAPLPRDPAVDTRPVNPGWIEVTPSSSPAKPPSEPNPWAQPTQSAEPARPTEARPGRTETFPREVREAYAVLELPLGADRSRIDQAFKGLVQRYHPDHHMGQPELQRTAAELTMRLKDARELLYAWLEGRR